MASIVETAQPQAADGNQHRLIGQFYLSILSITAIDLCFALIYEIPLDRFLAGALPLVLLSLGGGYAIFAPIQRFLLNPTRDAFPVRRIATLGSLSTAYMAAVLGTLAAVKFLLLPDLLNFDIASLLTANEQLWLPVLHTLYYTGLIYFVMLDYEAVLRVAIVRDYAMRVPAARGRLLYRLLAAFGITTLLPMSLIVLHVFERNMTEQRDALVQDVAASALALCVTLIFVTRSLLRPIRALESAMVRVQNDDLEVMVPVLSNDETGKLAEGFNRMVQGLRERTLIRETFGRYIPQNVANAMHAFVRVYRHDFVGTDQHSAQTVSYLRKA